MIVGGVCSSHQGLPENYDYCIIAFDLGITAASGYLRVNHDDDDGDRVIDWQDNSNPSENDLVQLNLDFLPSDCRSGRVKLEVDNDEVKIWSSPTKEGLVLPYEGLRWRYYIPNELPHNLWIEAINMPAGGAATVRLTYQVAPQPSEWHDVRDGQVSVTLKVVKAHVIYNWGHAVPEYLFASADYATPIHFEVSGLGGLVHVWDIGATFHYKKYNEPPAEPQWLSFAVPIGQRFVACDLAGGSNGYDRNNDTTNKYVGYVSHDNYSAIDLGESHRTDEAYFILSAVVSEVKPSGEYGPPVTVTTALTDSNARVRLLADDFIFAGEPGIGTNVFREYTKSFEDADQLPIQLYGESDFQHCQLCDCPRMVNTGSGYYFYSCSLHDQCHSKPLPHSDDRVDGFDELQGFDDCTQDTLMASSGARLYTRLEGWSTDFSDSGHVFKNRIYGWRKGAYFCPSYGGKQLASGILNEGEYAMDLEKTSGNYDWELFKTGQYELTNNCSVSGGIGAGTCSALCSGVGAGCALLAPVGTPWAALFGLASAAFRLIYLADADGQSFDISDRAESVLYVRFTKTPFGLEPMEFDLGSDSQVSAGTRSLNKPISRESLWVVGDAYEFFIELESVSSAQIKSVGSVDTSSFSLFRCTGNDTISGADDWQTWYLRLRQP